MLTPVCALSLGFVLCVSRDPEERQLGPPVTSEEGSGGSEGQTAESSLLRPAAAAHQLTAHRDYSRLS